MISMAIGVILCRNVKGVAVVAPFRPTTAYRNVNFYAHIGRQ